MISLGTITSLLESWHYEEGHDKEVFETGCKVLDYIKSVRDTKNYNITGRDVEWDDGGVNFATCKMSDREYEILKNDILLFMNDNNLYGTLSYTNTGDGCRILSIKPNKLDKSGGIISESFYEERKKLPDSEFGIPSQRKYPLHDEEHVRSAIKLFGHVDTEHEEELANNINKKIKEYGMKVEVSEKNKFDEYYIKSDSINESTVFDTAKLSDIYDKYSHLIKWCRMDDGSFYNINPCGPEYTENGECIFAFSDCKCPEGGIDRIVRVLNNNKPEGCEEVYTRTEDTKIFYIAKVNKDIIYQTESTDIAVNESIETALMGPYTLDKNIKLYHGSHAQTELDIIKPVSENLGTRISNPRMSSFWSTSKEDCLEFALYKAIHDIEPKNKIYYSNEGKWIVYKDDLDNIYENCKNKKIYVYSKVFPKKYVFRGHMTGFGRATQEFTCDLDVRPDSVECYTYKDFKYILDSTLLPILTNDEAENENILKTKSFLSGKMKGNLMERLLFYDANTVIDKRKQLKKDLQKSNAVKESSFVIPELEIEPLTEADIQSEDKCPVYIVTVFTGSPFGKAITKVTKSAYSHAALSFDSSLDKLYSFNLHHGIGRHGGGLSFESIDQYLQDSKDSIIQVNVLFLKKKDYDKLKVNFDKYLANAKNTSYDIGNNINVLLNKATDAKDQLSMICSQFVDSMFKAINVDITNKPSNLVTPANLSSIQNPKIYKIYEGRVDGYNKDDIRRKIKSLTKKAEFIKESAIVLEARSLPKEFNSKGDLLVMNPKGVNIELEHSVSKKIFPSYKKHKDIDGMKYEVCKLWYLNTLLLEKINKNPADKDQLYALRSKVLNEHALYLNEILKNDPTFNFAEFYESTPFGEAQIKISGSTIKHSINLFKQIIK